MQTGGIVASQTCIMFLYMMCGYFLSKSGKLTERGSKDLASILMSLFLPAVIVNSFCETFSTQKLVWFGISTLAAALALAICFFTSRLIFRRAPTDFFSCAFTNAGFMGIPLVQSLYGIEAVSYLVGYLALLNLLQWWKGLRILTGKDIRMNIKTIVSNPLLIAPFIGLLLFCTGLGGNLPGPVSTALNGLAGANGPLAMVVLGSYLAKSSFRELFLSPRQYAVCAVRLILIPLVVAAAFAFLPIDRTVRLTVFIASAAPVGSTVAIYSQMYDLDYPYACRTVALSTLLSILTLPLVITVATYAFH